MLFLYILRGGRFTCGRILFAQVFITRLKASDCRTILERIKAHQAAEMRPDGLERLRLDVGLVFFGKDLINRCAFALSGHTDTTYDGCGGDEVNLTNNAVGLKAAFYRLKTLKIRCFLW